MNIYVANISFKTKEEDLKTLFAGYGKVNSCKIITERETGRSRGFGFVEMPNASEGNEAIKELNNFDFMDRTLNVRVAEDRQKK